MFYRSVIRSQSFMEPMPPDGEFHKSFFVSLSSLGGTKWPCGLELNISFPLVS